MKRNSQPILPNPAKFLAFAWFALAISSRPCARAVAGSDPAVGVSSTWPQAYSVMRHKTALTLSTAYYTVQQDLKRGGAISSIRLTYGKAANLLAAPFETHVQSASGEVYSDLWDTTPRIRIQRDGLNDVVRVDGELRGSKGQKSGVRVSTVYQYRWGYIRIHKELHFPRSEFRLRELCPVSTAVSSSLCQYGYRDGLTEAEGAPRFAFGSCHWGRVGRTAVPAVEAVYLPRYVMLADPGVEGLEWFASDDLAQWDRQVAGKRGLGRAILCSEASRGGIKFSVSPLYLDRSSLPVPEHLQFDYYIAFPLLEGHAPGPWFHASFNRNRGEWVKAQQVRRWAEEGIQTVHCHNDGDYYGDGLFWRDGSYPPYPDMEQYDQVIEQCHKVGIRVATYFSNKELHPSTPEFRTHGLEWGRMDRQGELQHNFFKGTNEFGVQMCLRSGWLNYLEASIDRVLTNNPLDGVYYDWNVALLCCNPRHEKLKPGQAAAGHWDIDELLTLMEWTRRRVGPHGLVIIHNTTTPMFATENFADDVVANEWGYGKWSGPGPSLEQLPLEWSLVNARRRGVISYGQLDAQAPRRLHRLFALEALLAGVTPWPADAETFKLYPVLKPIGQLESCRFADWRNSALTLGGPRAGAAVYSRPGEAWIVVGNLQDTSQKVRCVLHPERLPYPLSSLHSATLVQWDSNSQSGPGADLDVAQLTDSGLTLTVGPESAVLLRVL